MKNDQIRFLKANISALQKKLTQAKKKATSFMNTTKKYKKQASLDHKFKMWIKQRYPSTYEACVAEIKR